MEDETQNKCNSFTIGTCVTLLGLNNLEFNKQVGVIESLVEQPYRQDVTLHPLTLQCFWHFN